MLLELFNVHARVVHATDKIYIHVRYSMLAGRYHGIRATCVMKF